MALIIALSFFFIFHVKFILTSLVPTFIFPSPLFCLQLHWRTYSLKRACFLHLLMFFCLECPIAPFHFAQDVLIKSPVLSEVFTHPLSGDNPVFPSLGLHFVPSVIIIYMYVSAHFPVCKFFEGRKQWWLHITESPCWLCTASP